MILVIAGILASAGLGVTVEHRWRERTVPVTDRAIQLLRYGLRPFVTFCSLARLDLGSGVGLGLLAGWSLDLRLAASAVAWTTGVAVVASGTAGVVT